MAEQHPSVDQRTERERQEAHLSLLFGLIVDGRNGPNVYDPVRDQRVKSLSLGMMRHGFVKLGHKEWVAEDEATARMLGAILAEDSGLRRDEWGCLPYNANQWVRYPDGDGHAFYIPCWEVLIPRPPYGPDEVRDLIATIWILAM